MSEDKVTLGVDAGSREAGIATEPIFLPLRKLLAAHCTSEYSSVVREFAIVLRVGGEAASFEGEGVQRLRISKKDACVTADFVVPEARWRDVSSVEIREYLASGMLETLQAMCEHLKKRKIEVDTEKLMADASEAIAVLFKR